MILILYSTKDSPRKVIKTTQEIVRVTGTLRVGTTFQNPVIERVSLVAPPVNCNYMYIPEFGRYYYVGDIKTRENGLYDIPGHVDVLASFWASYKSSPAVIARCENEALANKLLPDEKLPMTVQFLPQYLTWPKGMTHNQSGTCIALTVAGAKIT